VWRTAIALVPIAALLGACGSGGSEPLSRDRLVQRANEICAEHIREIDRLEEGLDPTDDVGRDALADFARVLPQIADKFRRLTDDLGELEPPESIAEQYELTLSRIDRVADQLDRAATEAEEGDRRAFQAVLEEEAAAESTERFFRENGFRECA
jgi:hypothetical protein